MVLGSNHPLTGMGTIFVPQIEGRSARKRETLPAICEPSV
jgi:hypothetical protein